MKMQVPFLKKDINIESTKVTEVRMYRDIC